MRELTANLLLISIGITIIITIIALIRMDIFSKLNLSDKEYRVTDECNLLLDKQERKIERLQNYARLFYIVLIFVFIDTLLIYEKSLLKAFNENKVLVCSYKKSKILVTTKTFEYSNKNSFIPSGQLASIDDNFRIDLDMCKIKNRRWWQ